MGPFLSVILPAYNEAERLPPTLKKLSEELRQMNFEYEIIIVNDGSKDGTRDAIRKIEAETEHLTCIDYKENKGKGFAIRKGMLAARGMWRLFMDADGASPFSEFKKMMPYLNKEHGILIGSRFVKGAEVLVPQPNYRKTLSRLGNFLIRVLLLPDILDTHCGFKCFRSDAAEKIFERTKIDRWAFDDEALLLAILMGYPVKEIPITWSDRREHSTFKLSDYVFAFFDVIKIKYWLATGKYNV